MDKKPGDNYLKKEFDELIKSDEFIFDFIQENSLGGFWYWDLEKPENCWMNSRFWTTLGYNPDEMLDLTSAWQDIINQDDLKIALDNITKHPENPNRPYDQIVRYTHQNGWTVWVICAGRVIEWSVDGTPMRMVGFNLDITQCKKLEERLKENELKLKQKNAEYVALNKELLQANKELRQTYDKLFQSELNLKKQYEESAVQKEELFQLNEDLQSITGKSQLKRVATIILQNPLTKPNYFY